MTDERATLSAITIRLDGQDASTEAHPPNPPVLLVFFRDGTQVIHIPATDAVTIGRGRPASAIVPDPSLSREHARFRLTTVDETGAPAVEVVDLGSTNGTFVNQARVERAIIGRQDEVRLGKTRLELHPTTADAAAAAGVDRFDRLVELLAYEVQRARTFERSVAVVFVRLLSRKEEDEHRWLSLLRKQLRPVDRLARYGETSVLVMLPEVGAGEAELWARGALTALDFPLLFGIAVFPETAKTADHLLEVARSQLAAATEATPIRASGPLASVGAAGRQDGEQARPGEGRASQMDAVYAAVEKVARKTLPVLITGETGSGKEVVAQAIHRSSGRPGPLRAINCGAIPGQLVESILFGHERGAFTGAEQARSGLFEAAARGTLFLDEVGELPARAQAALLRVLETRLVSRLGSEREIETDVRVIAATHRDLPAMSSAGTFRQDLLYRLNAVTIEVPPLRERRSEIASLARAFVRQAGQVSEIGISPEALAALEAYSWPGNIRELRNVIDRAVAFSDAGEITCDDLPGQIRRLVGVASPPTSPAEGDDLSSRLERYELELILSMLQQTGWNQSEAARRLGIPRKRIQRRLQQHGIRAPSDRPPSSGDAQDATSG